MYYFHPLRGRLVDRSVEQALFKQAIEACFTPEAWVLFLSEEIGYLPGGYLPVVHIVDRLTSEEAEIWNRKARGETPRDMPKQGSKIFDHQ